MSHWMRSRAGRVAGLAGHRALRAVVVALAIGAPSVRSQIPPDTVIRGQVLDFQSAEPIGDVLITERTLGLATTSGENGTFAIVLNEPRVLHLLLQRVGYRTTSVTVGTSSHGDLLSISMSPDPVALGGLDVTVARTGVGHLNRLWDRRRRAYGGSVVRLDQAKLARSAAPSVREDVQSVAPDLRPCNRQAVGNLCFGGAGRGRPPRVCIDGVRAAGDAADLGSYDPSDMYSVEVYDRGRLIIAYTHRYIERSIGRVLAVQPSPGLEC